MPQKFLYLLKFFIFIVISFELLLQILPFGIQLYTTPVRQQCSTGINKTRLHITKFFGSCTTTMLSHKCTWGKYITIDPCYHNNQSLLGIQLKQSITVKPLHSVPLCVSFLQVSFFPGPMKVDAQCTYFQGTCTDSAIFCKEFLHQTKLPNVSVTDTRSHIVSRQDMFYFVKNT